jgi:hypothetical protein
VSTTQTSVTPAGLATEDSKRQLRIRLLLFLASLVVSVAAFVTIDYFYSAAILRSTVSGGPHGFCFSRDPVRAFGFRADCSCIRPWLGTSYEFNTNSLGFRDERIREVPLSDVRPRILLLGDSEVEGMTAWQDSFVGRLASEFPQYEFLNGAVEGYSPSNYLNTARMLMRQGVGFDEAIVFVDLSDAQDEAAFFHDVDSSGAVATAAHKTSRTSSYGQARLWINDHLLLTNDIFDYVEKALVGLGWYHLDLGHGGNEFDLDRLAWTYRKVSDTEPYETGYGPLGLEGGIAKEKSKMDTLWRELRDKNIPLSVVVFPAPPQLAHDTVDSRQVHIWQEWCEGKCKRFVSLFPAFFAIKEKCSTGQPGCWYINDFIFGDTHYNAAGDAVVADALTKELNDEPAAKRQPPVTAAQQPSEATSQQRSGRRR